MSKAPDRIKTAVINLRRKGTPIKQIAAMCRITQDEVIAILNSVPT